MGFCEGIEVFDIVFGDLQIIIQDEDVVVRAAQRQRMANGQVNRPCPPQVAIAIQNSYFRKLCPQHFPCTVCRTVVRDDDSKILYGLPAERLETSPQQMLPVKNRNSDINHDATINSSGLLTKVLALSQGQELQS